MRESLNTETKHNLRSAALKRFNLTANQQAILAYSLAVKDPDGAYLAVHSKSGKCIIVKPH